MKRLLFVTFILFATLSLTLTNQAQTGPTAQTTFPGNRSVYTEPPPTAVFSAAKMGQSDTDITYCIANGVALKLSIFYPTVPTAGRLPVVVWVHGGSFVGNPRTQGSIVTGAVDGPAFTARGYAVAQISYRGLPRDKMPVPIEDTKCAIRYLRARADSYNINPERIGLIGPSAGGYLVAMDGLTDASAGFEGIGGFDGVSSRVQAVVALYPWVSFELPPFTSLEAEAREAALPPNPSQAFLHALSLPTYVSKNAPPFLFFVGEFDEMISPGRSLDLHNKLHAAGIDSTYVLVKGVGHGWDTPRLPKTPYGPEPTYQEITRAELDFFDKHLKK